MAKQFKANPNFMLRSIADEYILVPTGEAAIRLSGMITLNESGVLMWRTLQQPCSAAQLVDALMQEYEVDAATAAADVQTLLEKMLPLEMVIPAE